MAAFSSSATVFGNREDDDQIQMKQLQQHNSLTPSSSTAPQKKKRNQPGNPSKYHPADELINFIKISNIINLLIIIFGAGRVMGDPDAEVIAVSPKSLMATNRFICEVCNKGFQREQNLQLHRRGHNLPWKLKQKSTKEGEKAKRKVYVCPEPTCVHHDPSRALGDLTGIKKHYSRKHGHKNWICHKCSKKYAVQSDWKAHSKTCGTREYRCHCATIFSRRESLIRHRALCDALGEESIREGGAANVMMYGSSSSSVADIDEYSMSMSGGHQLLPQTNNNNNNMNMFIIPPQSNQTIYSQLQLPTSNDNSTLSPPNNLFSTLPFFSNEPSIMPNIHHTTSSLLTNMNYIPQMSATALLQKAAQMGATSSTTNVNATTLLGSTTSSTHHNDLIIINSSFGIGTNNPTSLQSMSMNNNIIGNSGGLTRDFLGVGHNILTTITTTSQQQQPPPHTTFGGGGSNFQFPH
ncbi:protein indeterminate-domain 4, chloroplastic [Senna tora]|uniref:Protein indeterminate-domain 4, chloroplastic n=1 Tax=Senna tora TaxID=362788 RepID=A0A834SVB9_9FABA|nr:protein indeterminate-domain 4, chloroplastic [Senna tora]